jgi:hypothetical protein
MDDEQDGPNEASAATLRAVAAIQRTAADEVLTLSRTEALDALEIAREALLSVSAVIRARPA